MSMGIYRCALDSFKELSLLLDVYGFSSVTLPLRQIVAFMAHLMTLWVCHLHQLRSLNLHSQA